MYLNETRLTGSGLKVMRGTVANDNYMCHIRANGFSDLIFYLAVIDKLSLFYEIAPDFTYSHKNRNFKSVIG